MKLNRFFAALLVVVAIFAVATLSTPAQEPCDATCVDDGLEEICAESQSGSGNEACCYWQGDVLQWCEIRPIQE